MEYMETEAPARRYLGHGKSSQVYLLDSFEDRSQTMAMKKFKEYMTSQSDLYNEVQAISDLQDHKHIIKMIDFDMDQKHILLEYLPHGELFDYIQNSPEGKLNEKLARFFFKSLFSALAHMHKNNYVHRDVKLENMLLDENFEIRLSDFGFSTKVERGEKLSRMLGTEGYMAPELVNGDAYYGQAVDMFAAGVALFCSVNGFAPFYSRADKTDPFYRYFSENRQKSYWELIERRFKFVQSEEFKNLINGLLSANPEKRLTVEEVLDHEWFNGETASAEEAKHFMSQIWKKMNKFCKCCQHDKQRQ